MPKFKRLGSCKLCGECCRNLIYEIEYEVEPNGQSKAEQAKELKQKEIKSYSKKGFYNIKAGKVTWLNNTVKFNLDLTCPYIAKDNKCTIHKNRPMPCREFPTHGVVKPLKCGYKFKKVI